ncbi:PE-PGRS family protein PE_PGRS57 [Mycobacterium tuberculosis H3004]|nr:PE-PGRS family protein PE_PGRS57 [Mycobacterium tuberculosis H3004]
MSFVLIAPEFVTAAAGDLTNLGSSISAANASAASATTQVLAAGADEVSARIAALFGGFGLEYQAISAQVAAYHQRFVQALSTGAGAYASAEAAAAEQIVLGVINAPTQALLGRPLIGDGANATTPGGAGGAGGLLFGNGGAGAARGARPGRRAWRARRIVGQRRGPAGPAAAVGAPAVPAAPVGGCSGLAAPAVSVGPVAAPAGRVGPVV